MPRENWEIGWRWLSGGDPSPMNRLRDASRLAGVIATGPLSQRPVRPLYDEARRPLPGDELVPAKVQWTNGVTIRARPTEIWPWLVQMGCTRAGVYSYDRLDNGGVPSADRIIPELQHVEVGDILPWTPKAEDGFIVRAVEPERALVLGEETGSFSWTFVLEPIDETRTRLLARVSDASCSTSSGARSPERGNTSVVSEAGRTVVSRALLRSRRRSESMSHRLSSLAREAGSGKVGRAGLEPAADPGVLRSCSRNWSLS
jgi:hypothetical protein